MGAAYAKQDKSKYAEKVIQVYLESWFLIFEY